MVSVLMRIVLELPQGLDRCVQYAALFAAGYLWIRARRRKAASAAEVKSTDPRPPIILLRSFGDDMMRIRPKRLRWSFIDGWYLRGVTFERVVADQLSRHGPVVAIGRPGEALRPLGAARDYVPDERWQAEVRGWMLEARFVVVIVGASTGLSWEVEQLCDLRLMEKTAFLFPPARTGQLETRWGQLLDALQDRGPLLPRELSADSTLLLAFEHSGDSIALESKSRDEWSYETALRVGVAIMSADSRIGIGEPRLERDSKG